MGCCVSSNARSAVKKNPGDEDRIQDPKENRAPLPEEESVKEVLSETTSTSLPKKPAVLPRTRQEWLLENDDPRKIQPLLPTVKKSHEEKLKVDGVFKKAAGSSSNSEEFFPGDASELCSTHSGRSVLSTATYNSTDNYKHDDEDQRSFRQRSFSGDSRRERVVGRSPVRRSEQSPCRSRNGPGVGSRGGSRSPAKRGDNGGSNAGMVRGGSARKTGKSRGRVTSDRSDKIRKLDEFSGSNRQNRNMPPTTGDESLENPLVSLECFIFL